MRINIKTSNFRKKLFQVQFHQGRQGFQILVQPYVTDTNGLLSLVSHKKGESTASLLPGGRITRHIVKYSHPIDGNAHFSQTGRIYSTVRNVSKPLTNPGCGHLFTVMCHGLDGFQDYTATTDRRGQDLNLEPSDSNVEEKMIRLTAFWYHVSAVRQSKEGAFGPKVVWLVDGEPRNSFLLSPNNTDEYLHECVLMLSYELVDAPEDPSQFTLMGGFDLGASAQREENKLMVMNYPATDNVSNLESVDFIQSSGIQP